MVSSDTELVEQVRQFTGYSDGSTFDDSDVQEILDIAKEELRSYLSQPNFTFYQTAPQNTHDADRALFWFTCIGLKVRAGEIASANLTITEIEQTSPPENFEFWFDQFWSRLQSAQRQEVRGAQSTQLSRTGRSYEYQQPDYGGE